MLVFGTIVMLALFLLVGWAVSTEMFQQRAWRRRVAAGDVAIVCALLEESMNSWRRARPPKGVKSGLWVSIQGAQLIAVTADTATVSTSAEAEFRIENGRRVQASSALDEAINLASRLVDMLLYDVANLRLEGVRVDVFTTFASDDQDAIQKPILTTTAWRTKAEGIDWEALTPEEVLGRFDTSYERGLGGRGVPVEIPEVDGIHPADIVHKSAEQEDLS